MEIQNKNIVDKYDKRLSVVITMTIFFLFLVNLSNGISLLTHINYETVSMLLKIVLGVALLSSVNVIIKRFNYTMLKVIIASTIIIILNVLLFPQNNPFFINTVITYLITCFPLIICVLALKDYNYLLYKLLNISFLITGIAFVVTLLFLLGYIPDLFNNSYAMGFSYSCLMPLLVLFRDFIWNKRTISLVSFLLLFLVIIIFGSRGAILCFIVYSCIVIYRKNNYLYKKNTTMIIVFLFILLLVLLYKPLLSQVNTLLNNFGISSRTIILLLQPEIHLSGRDVLYSTVINDFIKNPFILRGINADYLIIGGYSHSFIIELLYEFGIILGGVFVITIFYYCIVTIFISFYNDYVDFLVVLFCCSIPALLVSGTLWTSYSFWLWLVLCCSLKKNKLGDCKSEYSNCNR